MDRYKHISINDSNLWATMALPHARHAARTTSRTFQIAMTRIS
jgi:hypothetical protein